MRKNVLQLVASSHGGAATHVRDLAFHLPPDHYQNTIAMSLDGGNVTPEMFTERGIDFAPLAIDRGFSWAQVKKLRQVIKEKQIDILHAHGARAAMFGRLAVRELPARPQVIFSIHGFATPFYRQPKRGVYLWLERWLQGVTDCTIGVAQAEADLFLSCGLTTPANMRVVSYGIDVERFATANPDLDTLRRELGLAAGSVILTVCRLNVPRDFHSLLTAFKHVRERLATVQLIIVGDGPQRAMVEGLIAELGVEDAVHITGFRDDIPDLMALADIYVLTSYGWEGYPISTMEAQAAGVPVVVTDAGGSKEAVLHEKTGLVVPKRAPDTLAEALLALLADEGLRREVGRAGQDRSRQEFTVGQMVAKIERIYG